MKERDMDRAGEAAASIEGRRCFWCRRWAEDFCYDLDDLEAHERICEDRPGSEKEPWEA